MASRRLPVSPEDAVTACQSVRAGLTDDEVELTARLRALSQRARALRRELVSSDGEETARLALELDELRSVRAEVAAARERAYRDKMRALGHLDP